MNDADEYISLRFLHLSDIHFRKDVVEGPIDYDIDIREHIEKDAKKMSVTLGAVDAILVTGDIAFAGRAPEYQTAKEWLLKLAASVRCDPAILLTVPGNHDVDQNIYRTNFFLKSTLDALSGCNSVDLLNAQIQRVYASSMSEEIIYTPIQNYNQFATEFSCEITHKAQTWIRTFALSGGPTVRLVGFNSTLGSRDGDARAANLFLGLNQIAIPDDGALNVTLCHHPPDWLIDTDQVEVYLGSRAHIQLFGHKHVQRLTVINGKLRVSAGAVHPDRLESGWEPRYNFIAIQPLTPTSVNVRVYPRIWSGAAFAPDYNSCGGNDHVEHHFQLSSESDVTTTTTTPVADTVTSVPITETTERMFEEALELLDEREQNRTNAGMNYGRILLRRFMSLDGMRQRIVLKRVGLDEPAFEESGQARVLMAFKRAIERNVLKELWDAVEAQHADNLFTTNPFFGGDSHASKH